MQSLYELFYDDLYPNIVFALAVLKSLVLEV
jgi:hypothetical protein